MLDWVILALATTAGTSTPRPPAASRLRSSAAGAQATRSSPLEALALRALRDANAAGFIHVGDVSSGKVLVHASVSADGTRDPTLAIDSLLRPLSVIKTFVAASWLEHGFGRTLVDCAPSGGRPARRMLVEEVLSSGCDSAGAEMATIAS
jgi:hypothetical protein